MIVSLMMENNPQILLSAGFNRLMEVETEYHKVLETYWHQENFLTGRWWFLVALSVIPAVIWWILSDKRNLVEITAFGLFYGVAAILLDSIGSNAMVWTYPVRFSPYITPELYPYDIGVVIIPFMLVYQRWGKSFGLFFISTGLLSAIVSFGAEPFMEWLGIYKGITWKHIYSFPIYWLLGIISWWIIHWFKLLEQKHTL